jgi:endoglucanase
VDWRSRRTLEVKGYGGSPIAHLKDAAVWVADNQGVLTQGRLRNPRIAEHGRGIDSALVTFSSEQVPSHNEPADLFGGFQFQAPAWEEGRLLFTKAADDLVGVYAILATALEHAAKIRQGTLPFIGLITRAEEVGFIGAIGHFSLGWHRLARRPLLCVSIECSRELPSAEIGKGPVVRLGDRMTVFDPPALQVLSQIAAQVLPGQHQKKLMDGGACEASAAAAFGIPAIGISVPLGNYHNQCFKRLSGAGRSRWKTGAPAPECVHLDDIAGVITLSQALLRPGLPWRAPYAEKAKQFKASLTKYRSLLASR